LIDALNDRAVTDYHYFQFGNRDAEQLLNGDKDFFTISGGELEVVEGVVKSSYLGPAGTYQMAYQLQHLCTQMALVYG